MTATHTCPYSWCNDTAPGHIDHTLTKYVSASREDPGMSIGAGVWTDDTRPEIVDVSIHIDDQRRIDTLINLTTDEAKDLLVALHEAIDNAVAAEAVATNV